MIQLIIFDFDDTLVNNHNLDYKSFEIPCKKLSLIPPTKKDIKLSRKKGFLAIHMIKNYLKELNRKEFFKRFIKERNNFLEQDQTHYLTTQKNTHKLLQFLKKKNIKMIIITANKNKKAVLNFLHNEKLFRYFYKILFMDDLHIQLNNSTSSNRVLIKSSLLNKSLKNSKTPKTEILYVGNSLEDFESSKYFKINFIHFQNEYLPK